MRGGRQISANELQTTGRRRRRAGSRAAFLVIIVIFAVLLFYIRDIKMRLKEVQETLEQIVPVQNGGEGSGEGKAESGSSYGEAWRTKGGGEVQDEGEVALAVGRPVERTLEEALAKLEALGETNPTIREICVDSDSYEEKILLALANNPEMADFVAGYLESGWSETGGFSDDEKEKECPLLIQWDRRWGYVPYGDQNIGLSGCGPTCLSMVLYALTRDENETPGRIAQYAMENGYYVQGTGTAWALMKDYPLQRGVYAQEMQMDEGGWKAALDFGRVLICAMGPGDFTLSGHFIVIYDYDEEGFCVNDPNCIERSRQKWPFETLNGQIKNIWAYWT